LNPDLVIVGAGLAGASVAWHLRGKRRVLLIDQATEAGSEATAQNAGMLRRLGEDPYERKLAQRSHAFFQDPGEDWEGLSPSRKSGALMLLAHDPHHLEDGVSHLRAIGVQINPVAEPARVAPFLRGKKFCRAYHLPDARSCIPGDLLAGFLRGAQAHGAELRLGTEVTDLLIENGKIRGVQTSKGRVSCDQVLLAAGAWTSSLAARAGLQRPIVPLRRSLFFTGPHQLATPDHPWVWVDDVGIYARPFDGGFLLSPCDEAVDWPQAGQSSWGQTQAKQADLLSQKLTEYFPGLAGVKLQQSWTGLRSFSPDRRPLLGRDPEAKGLWWAAGLGGFGLSCSVGVGEALAAWIQGQETGWLDARMVSPSRPTSSRWLMRPSGQIHEGRLIPASTGPASART